MTSLPPPQASQMVTPGNTSPASAHPADPGSLPPPPPWPPSDASIVVDNVSKRFRGGVVAVSDVTFAVRPGVTALLGPNGAGKSTLIRMIAGLARPSTGRVLIMGEDPRTNAQARRQIGIVPQQDGVFERETALSTVTLSAVLNHLDQPEERAIHALQMVELDPGMDRDVGTFSKGMRQRVKIAQALVHQPPVLMLDEPLNGLDPRQRRHMISLFHHLGEQGHTVLVSSHVLEEVERFGSNIVVVSRGRMAAQGHYQAIRALMDNKPMRIRVTTPSAARTVAAVLVQHAIVSGCTVIDDDQIEVTTADTPRFRREIATVCKATSSRLEEVTPLDDDLESVFRYLVEGKN